MGNVARTSLALVIFSVMLGRPVFSATAHRGGWKQSLHRAGLIQKQSASGKVHATNHHVSTTHKKTVDPAQAAAQRLGIHIPSSIAPGPTNTVEPAKTTLFLDKLALRRAINPSRFDQNHPVIGALIKTELLLKGTSGASAATIALAEKSLLPDTKYYRYFEARRALDPGRFDKYHPLFGPLLAENQRVDNLLVAAEGINVSPQAVPEPGVLSLMVVGAGLLAAGGWSRKARSIRG